MYKHRLTPVYQCSSLTCKYLRVFRDVSIDLEQHVTLFAPSVRLFLALILIPEEVIPTEPSGMSTVRRWCWRGRRSAAEKRLLHLTRWIALRVGGPYLSPVPCHLPPDMLAAPAREIVKWLMTFSLHNGAP